MKKTAKDCFFGEIFCDSEYRGFYITIILLLTTVFLLLHYIFLGGGKKSVECLNNQNSTLVSDDQAPVDKDSLAYYENIYGPFDYYTAEIIQIGGLGSRIHQNDVWAISNQESFRLSEDWAGVMFNTPVDLMWVICQDGFTVTECKIGEKQDNGAIDDIFGCAVPIQDVFKNKANIVCTKDN